MRLKGGAMQNLDPMAGVERAVCQNPACQRPLSNTWRKGGRLCCECGLNHELSHPETRWMDSGSDADSTAGIRQEVPKKSAVRTRSARLAMVRLGLKALAAVAPAVAEERGARMFFTPQRAPRWTAPGISNSAATAFHFSLGEQEIACWSWGRG